MAYADEHKSYYSISDPTTQTEEVQYLTLSEIAVLRRTRAGVKVFNMDRVLNSYSNFKRIFKIYNENLVRRTTNKFAGILERVYKRYKIDQPLIPFIRSMTVEAYFDMIPEKYFKKLSFEKKIYMALIKSSINDEEKGLFFKQLRRIPEIKANITKSIDGQIQVLLGYILAGSGISYFLITKVIPKLMGVNKDIAVNLTTSYTIMYGMWIVAALIIFFRLLFEKYKNEYVKALIDKPIVGDLFAGINFIDLLTIYLIGQFSNINVVMSMYNSMFPYIAENDNPGSRQTLIKRILASDDKNKFFTMDGLIVLDSIEEKGTNEIIKTIQEQSEGYAQSLEYQTKLLSNIIQKMGLMLVAISVFGPILALLGIMTGIMDAVQNLRK